MSPKPQFSGDLVIYTEQIFNGKLYFLCSVWESEIKPNAPHVYWMIYARVISWGSLRFNKNIQYIAKFKQSHQQKNIKMWLMKE